MITILVLLAGIVLLLWFAVLIGMSMDTEAQRREWQRVARGRRSLREDRGTTTFVARRCDPETLCESCPFR